MHSFMLLVFSMMIILSQILKENSEYIAFMYILVPVYFTAGMKRFYQQALWKIIIRCEQDSKVLCPIGAYIASKHDGASFAIQDQ